MKRRIGTAAIPIADPDHRFSDREILRSAD